MLREALTEDEFRVIAPDLNRPSFERLDFEGMVAAASPAAVTEHPAVIVGSSLGALVALEVSRRGASVPLVLIAPALGFGARWTEKLAPGDPVRFFHHGQGNELEIHRRFFQQMARIDVDREPPAVRVAVVMGENDESVPFSGVRDVWTRWEAAGLAPGSRFVAIPDGDHGLVDYVDRIAAEIREAAAG